jgi:hypothetical protein
MGYHMQPCVTNGSQLVKSLDTIERGQLATCSLAEAGVEAGVNLRFEQVSKNTDKHSYCFCAGLILSTSKPKA